MQKTMKIISESERRAWSPGSIVLGMTDDCHVDHVCAGRPERLITELEWKAAKISNEFIGRMVRK